MSKTKNAIRKNRNDKDKSLVKKVHLSKSCKEPLGLPDYLEVFPVDISKEEIPEIEIHFPGFSFETKIEEGCSTFIGCESHHVLILTCYYVDSDTMSLCVLADKSSCCNTECKYKAECDQLYNDYLQFMDGLGVDYNGSQ